MKPGDEGGTDPATCLFRLRRSKKQHPNRRAAAPKMPNGMPTPSPIFWFLVSPSLLADGATGSLEALGVDFELVRAEMDEPALDADLEELADDLVEVENVTDWLDADEDCAALLGTEYDADGDVWEDCGSAVDDGQGQLVIVGVASAPVVVGGVGSRAVSGPNSLTK
jgi:hypothetical protein